MKLGQRIYTFLRETLYSPMSPSRYPTTAVTSLNRGMGAFMRIAILATAVASGAVSLALADPAAAAIRTPTNIASQELGSALRVLAADRRLQILYTTDTVANRRTSGAVGEFTVDEALTRLLGGTGLVFRYVDENTITVMSQGDSAAASERTTSLQGAEDVGDDRRSFWSRIRLAQADVHGQGDEGVPAQQDQGVSTLATVVVTAAKRKEKLTDVGSSISALTGERLAELGINSFQDFIRLTPGVSFQSLSPGRTQVQIRGINVGTTQPSSSVATYLDEVPLTAAATSALSGELNADPDPFDMNRIEILRGPQGTLYGANALGGVIKYVTKQPEYDRLTSALSLSTGSVHKGGENYGAKGMINIPLGGSKAALRVVVHDRKDAGFIDNAALDEKDVNWAKNRGGRVILALRPMDALEVKLTALTQRLTTGGESSVDAIRETVTPAFGDLTQFREVPEGISDRFNLYNAVISYDFESATLLSSSSVTRQEFSRSLTEIRPSVGARSLYVLAGENKKFVQEVRLQSRGKQDRGIEWQVGGYYTAEDYDRTTGFPTVDVATQQVVETFNSGTVADYTEKAGFANATYYFSPRFDIAAGLRYSHNKQSGHGVSNQGTFNGRSGASDDSKVTWSTTGRFRPNDDIMLYANVSTGYRAGGPNFFAIGQMIPPKFAPEELVNYEVGIKGGTSNGRATFSLSGFYIDWSSIQLPLIVNGLTFRGNNGTAESKGFEAAGTFMPTNGLTIGGALSYTDARITSNEPSLGAVPGDRMAGTPRWSGSLTADYETALTNTIDGFIGGTFTYSSDRPNSYKLSVNTPYQMIPGFSTLGLRTGIARGDWRLTLAADNLLDKRGITDNYTFERYYGESWGVGGPGSYYDQLGVIRPRTVSLTFDISF